jgi:hypothetical protein
MSYVVSWPFSFLQSISLLHCLLLKYLPQEPLILLINVYQITILMFTSSQLMSEANDTVYATSNFKWKAISS